MKKKNLTLLKGKKVQVLRPGEQKKLTGGTGDIIILEDTDIV